MLRGQVLAPRWSVLHSLTQSRRMICGRLCCRGQDRLHSRQVTVASHLLDNFVTRSPMHPGSIPIAQSCLPPSYQAFSCSVFLGQKLLAIFTGPWILNLKVKHKVLSPDLVLNPEGCPVFVSCLSIASLDLILPANIWPWLGWQELLLEALRRKMWL